MKITCKPRYFVDFQISTIIRLYDHASCDSNLCPSETVSAESLYSTGNHFREINKIRMFSYLHVIC